MVPRSLLQSLAERKQMILFGSSHILEVVERVCHRVRILRPRQVAAHDPVTRLRELAV